MWVWKSSVVCSTVMFSAWELCDSETNIIEVVRCTCTHCNMPNTVSLSGYNQILENVLKVEVVDQNKWWHLFSAGRVFSGCNHSVNTDNTQCSFTLVSSYYRAIGTEMSGDCGHMLRFLYVQDITCIIHHTYCKRGDQGIETLCWKLQ